MANTGFETRALLRNIVNYLLSRRVILAFVILNFMQYSVASANEDFRIPEDSPPADHIRAGPSTLDQNRGMPKALREETFSPVPAKGSPWVSQGPAPSLNGQVENLLTGNEVSGCVHVVLPHSVNADILYAGAVNGGVWKTVNATSASPSWSPLTDGLPSLSIGALEFDYYDPTHETLVAGVGRFSSFKRDGGKRVGIYKTTNGGESWCHSDGGGILNDKNISGVAVRGSTMVVSVDFAESNVCDAGIFRSTDGGITFSQLSLADNGMPAGAVYDIEGHPSDPSLLYCAVVFADLCMGAEGHNGIYKSTDTAASWSKVSNIEMETLLVDYTTSNVELAIHDNGTNVVYAAILNSGQLIKGGVFRSTDSATSWERMGALESNTLIPVGTNPRFKPDAGIPGGQGGIHFSIEADPFDSNVIYVGGDRQPTAYEEGATSGAYLPNWIGAMNFTGRLFRGNASFDIDNQWVHLTHVMNQGFFGGGTLNSSAPHADSREMAFDANGDIIEGDDGGIYRRTSPESNQGDWLSINGNLQVTEIHNIAYDSLSDTIISGNQDTGTTYQSAPGSTTWDSFSQGDGGNVAVDNVTNAGVNESIRYSSYPKLDGFSRSVWDANGELVGLEYPTLTGFIGKGQFNTPVELNHVAPTHLVFAGEKRIYESFDQGDSVVPLSPDMTAYAMDYGGSVSSETNPDVLWAAGVEGPRKTPSVRIRTTSARALSTTSYFGSVPIDIVMDPSDYRAAYVIDERQQLWRTTDAGESFHNVTGTLAGVGAFRSLVYYEGALRDFLLVGADRGVFFVTISRFPTKSFRCWKELGNNLPNAPVYDMVYSVTDDVLAVGTLGRGAWTVPNFSVVIGDRIPWCGTMVLGNASTAGHIIVNTATYVIVLAALLCLRRRKGGFRSFRGEKISSHGTASRTHRQHRT